jgi:hypothetical protein
MVVVMAVAVMAAVMVAAETAAGVAASKSTQALMCPAMKRPQQSRR